jgi:hypothetical protein
MLIPCPRTQQSWLSLTSLERELEWTRAPAPRTALEAAIAHVRAALGQSRSLILYVGIDGARAGRFTESDDVSRSLAQDRRTRARLKAKKGQGDRGERYV